jgi:hypothetical protein
MKPTKALRFLAPLTILPFLLPTTSWAQYTRTDLTSNQENVAPNVNPKLVNAWGLVQLGTSPVWISDNGTGFSTLYNGSGLQLGLIVLVPGLGGAPRHSDRRYWQHRRERGILCSLIQRTENPDGLFLSSQPWMV